MSDTISQASTTPGETGEDPPIEAGRKYQLRLPSSPFQDGISVTARITSGLLWALYFVLAFAVAYLVTFALLVD